MLRDLVIADVSDEILKSRIGGDSLGATLNTVTNQDAKKCVNGLINGLSHCWLL
jgi:hypothetical protein